MPSASARVAGWRVVAAGENVPSLYGVAALSNDDVWAAGKTGTGKRSRPAVAHWDGRTLQVLYPAPPSVHGSLLVISATAGDDVWVAGEETIPRVANTTPLLFHWDGHDWRAAALPRLPPDSEVSDVKALTRDDVWAVGAAGPDRALALHYDGAVWRNSDIRSVSGGGTSLSAVDGSSPNDVWAVGGKDYDEPTTLAWSDLILHWNGEKWSEIDTRFDDATGVTADGVAVAPWQAIWTLHSDKSGTYISKIVRWNGWTRSAVTVSDFYPPGEEELYSITPVDRRDVWVLGQRCPDFNNCTALVLHWSGHGWRTEKTPFDRLPDTEPTDAATIPGSHDLWVAGDHILAQYR
jgi:hypothetical protein